MVMSKKLSNFGVCMYDGLSLGMLDCLELSKDGEILTIRHGDSSIELHKNGCIRIKGKDIVTSASGRNRAEGAYIELN